MVSVMSIQRHFRISWVGAMTWNSSQLYKAANVSEWKDTKFREEGDHCSPECIGQAFQRDETWTKTYKDVYH